MTVLFFALLQFLMLVSVLDLNGLCSLQPELTTSEMPSHFPEFLALPSSSSSDLEVFAYYIYLRNSCLGLGDKGGQATWPITMHVQSCSLLI